MKNWGLLVVLLLGVFSCERNNAPVDNLPPETVIAIDSIQRTGELRLNANVHLHWFGSDADGFIAHYEVQVNNGSPVITTATDSVFTFVIDAGLDSADV